MFFRAALKWSYLEINLKVLSSVQNEWIYIAPHQCSQWFTVAPLNTADLGTDEKAAVFGNRRYSDSFITYKTLIWDLEMGGGIGGRRYWEGWY